MWKGKIMIGNCEADVVAHSTTKGSFEEWGGHGTQRGSQYVMLGEHDTELGRIIVNHIDALSGNFTFVGSAAPLIQL